MWEPGERLILGDTVRPRTARDLLRELAVEQASPSNQREAVEEWLWTAEPPDPLLHVSLERHGLPTSPVEFSRPGWGRSFVVLAGATSMIEVEPIPGGGFKREVRSGRT